MKKIYTLLMLCAIFTSDLYSQFNRRYFDGNEPADSLNFWFSIIPEDIWQIGSPQKQLFDSAATLPNALVTLTQNVYPVNNTSSFVIPLPNWYHSYGVLVLRWSQMLDMEKNKDGGIIEFSVDKGITWTHAFDNPYAYNFYGFDEENVDTLESGVKAFTGIDSTWKDIWLCFELDWLNSHSDTVLIRYTFTSDGTQTNQDGWMMDNFMAGVTILHTINKTAGEEYIEIGPNPTKGRIDIHTRKENQFHIIEEIRLVDVAGRLVKEWGKSPTKFQVDISDQPDGLYVLKVKTNLDTREFRVLLQH